MNTSVWVNHRAPLLGGARLRYYGFLPLVEKQHRKLDDISQIKDPTMETFFSRQKGIDDLPLFFATDATAPCP